MKLLYLNVFLVLGFFIATCDQPKSNTSKPRPKIDTSKSFKIDGLWATPKPSIDFNSFADAGSDTLSFALCGEYVYSPFGPIKNKSAFGTSLLKNFTVANRTDKTETGPVDLQILKHASSKLIFFFNNDTEAETHSDIYKGEIYDSDIQFINGIRIGMRIDDFYKCFFNYFPDELKIKYKVIVLESCITGIKHIYVFDGGKLKSVRFVTDYSFKSDY
jgi:hypothetical protein